PPTNPATLSHASADRLLFDAGQRKSDHQSIAKAIGGCAEEFAAVCRDIIAVKPSSKSATGQETPGDGYLVINPLSFTRTVGVALPNLSSPPEVDEIVAAIDRESPLRHAVVEIPPFGF